MAHVDMYKVLYDVGTRIVLEVMGEDPLPIPSGSRGTVVAVDDLGTVHCDFDNGRKLGLVPGVDTFRALNAKELAEERSSLDSQIQSAESLADSVGVESRAVPIER